MIVLLVGPSAVGKTKTYQAVEGRFPSCVFRHLDGLASQYARPVGLIPAATVRVLDCSLNDPDRMLAVGLEAIQDLADRRPDQHRVIDVGAGFQNAAAATRLPDQFPTIALVADPQVVYSRWQGRSTENTGSLGWYMSREFSDTRRTLYNRAAVKIDTTGITVEQAADQLAAALRRVLPAEQSGDSQ